MFSRATSITYILNLHKRRAIYWDFWWRTFHTTLNCRSNTALLLYHLQQKYIVRVLKINITSFYFAINFHFWHLFLVTSHCLDWKDTILKWIINQHWITKKVIKIHCTVSLFQLFSELQTYPFSKIYIFIFAKVKLV